MKSGESVSYTTKGLWSLTSDGEKTSAKGNDEGTGRLIGVLMQNYELSDPFELDEAGTIVSPGEGKLYLRCRDAWTELGNNSGVITVRFERSI